MPITDSDEVGYTLKPPQKKGGVWGGFFFLPLRTPPSAPKYTCLSPSDDKCRRFRKQKKRRDGLNYHPFKKERKKETRKQCKVTKKNGYLYQVLKTIFDT
jgi:hypothetical protein